ncbi:MAG: hypothetical protein LBK56_03930 [Gracilibacteraceae bacterium]|nr:hypothetical protein [Gracilibacteraceae bacterium]
MNAHKLEQLKIEYHAVVIPEDELDRRLRKAILLGQAEQKRRRRRPSLRIWAMAAAAFCVLITGIYYVVNFTAPEAPQTAQTDTDVANPSPPESEPPVSPEEDQVLPPAPPEDNTEEPPAAPDRTAAPPAGPGSGADTGGGNVVITKEDTKEDIVIRTPEKDISKEVASWQVDYTDDDSALTVTGDGVAGLAAQGMLEQLKDSEYISNVYQVGEQGNQITVVLKEPVRLEIYGGDGSDEVVMSFKKPEKEKIYVLRTNSYATEDALSEWKTRLENEPLTVRSDAESGYYLEAGLYTAREDAESKLQEILAAGDMDLFIEERETGRTLNMIFLETMPAA